MTIDDRAWAAAVGDGIADVTHVEDDGATLLVLCPSALWCRELSDRVEDIASRLPRRGIHFGRMPYSDYLQTSHWAKVRAAAMKASDGRCALDKRHPAQHVHHRTYERIGLEAADDLIVLCAECHAKHHDKL